MPASIYADDVPRAVEVYGCVPVQSSSTWVRKVVKGHGCHPCDVILLVAAVAVLVHAMHPLIGVPAGGKQIDISPVQACKQASKRNSKL